MLSSVAVFECGSLKFCVMFKTNNFRGEKWHFLHKLQCQLVFSFVLAFSLPYSLFGENVCGLGYSVTQSHRWEKSSHQFDQWTKKERRHQGQMSVPPSRKSSREGKTAGWLFAFAFLALKTTSCTSAWHWTNLLKIGRMCSLSDVTYQSFSFS